MKNPSQYCSGSRAKDAEPSLRGGRQVQHDESTNSSLIHDPSGRPATISIFPHNSIYLPTLKLDKFDRESTK